MRVLSGFICIFLSAFTAVASAETHECLIGKYAQYAQAQEQWQKGMTQLIIEKEPKYIEVAQRYLEDQLRYIELSQQAVTFLAGQAADQLRAHLSMNRWLSLSIKDRQVIAKANERYAALLQEAELARKRPSHPDGDALREMMRSEIMPSDAYKTLFKQFRDAVKAAEAVAC